MQSIVWYNKSIERKNSAMLKTWNEKLISAASFGNLPEIKRALENGANVNTKTKLDGDSPLALAAFNGNLECLEYLIEAKAEIDHENDYGSTALIYATTQNHADCLKILIDAGADINISNSFQSTALLLASVRGNLECLELLIAENADIEAQNKSGDTALTYATLNSHRECVEALIMAGAKIDVLDSKQIEQYSYKINEFKKEITRKNCAAIHEKKSGMRQYVRSRRKF